MDKFYQTQIVEQIKSKSKELNIPFLREKTSQILQATIMAKNPKNILEIGTAIGYSGALMLSCCQAKLTTVEKDLQKFEIAKQNLQSFKDRVHLINDDAQNVISYLKDKYDFILLDGPKGQYVKYLPILSNLLAKDGILFSDDVFYHNLIKGDAIAPKKQRTIVNNMRLFLDNIKQSDQFDSILLDIEDGICISKKL